MFLSSGSFTQLYIINQSTVLEDSDLTTITSAVIKSLIDFCNAWKLQSVVVLSIGKGKPIPSNGVKLYIMDDPDVEGAYGYHTLVNNIPSAKIFVKLIQQQGGAILYSPTTPLSVAQVVSHEVFEMLSDTFCNAWWLTGDGRSFYAAEVCDPVQGNIIPVVVGEKTVGISDYILPAWSNPQSTTGPYNKLNTLLTPMTVDKRGYVIKVSAGAVSYMFGESVDQTTKDKQNATLRADPRFSSLSVQV
jgi:hypothetical protein